jgi:hypothetical protein
VRHECEECIGTSKIQIVKSSGILKDIPMDPDIQINPMETDKTQAQTHIHSKSLSRINLRHNWCNKSWEYTCSPVCGFIFGRSDL